MTQTGNLRKETTMNKTAFILSLIFGTIFMLIRILKANSEDEYWEREIIGHVCDYSHIMFLIAILLDLYCFLYGCYRLWRIL